MNHSPATLQRLLTGATTPPLDVSLVDGREWHLSQQRPENFTLVIVLRGWHCSFCKSEAETLQNMLPDFSAIGISVLVVTMDDLDRARKACVVWRIPDLPYAYGLSEQQARAWGLYISNRVKPAEPEIFSEPGAFLIKPDGTLYSQFQSTAPWLRLDFSVLYRGIQLAMERGTPPRGGQ
jgi:peroxiredoxin